jgi:hypothetical protein
MITKDMSAPNWARTLKRLRRMAQELRDHDVQVIEPPNFELPPGRRYAQGGLIDSATGVVVGERGPELLVGPDGHRRTIV